MTSLAWRRHHLASWRSSAVLNSPFCGNTSKAKYGARPPARCGGWSTTILVVFANNLGRARRRFLVVLCSMLSAFIAAAARPTTATAPTDGRTRTDADERGRHGSGVRPSVTVVSPFPKCHKAAVAVRETIFCFLPGSKDGGGDKPRTRRREKRRGETSAIPLRISGSLRISDEYTFPTRLNFCAVLGTFVFDKFSCPFPGSGLTLLRFCPRVM